MSKKRRAGQGSVHLRKDGRWEGRYVIGYNDKGLPKTKNVLAKTKSECQQKLKALIKENSEGSGPCLLKADMRFGDWLDYWYQNHAKPRLRPNTQQEYEVRIYRHIIPMLGDIPLDRLSPNDLQQFYHELKNNGRLRRTDLYGAGLSDRSVRGCHITCRAALDKAVAEKLIRTNPAAVCKPPSIKKKEMQVLTREEMRRFLIQAKEDGYLELFLLDLSTGLRRGELLALQWSDLNFDTGELRVTKQICRVNGKLVISEPKTKASVRTLLLPPVILDMLKAHKASTHSRWMFPSPKIADVPLDPAAVRKRLSKILALAGCKHVRFHDLRHTFATTSLEYGMDVKTLPTIIGHNSVATTLNIYAHITDDMRAKAAASIDRGIAKQEQIISPAQKPASENMTVFTAVKGQRRKQGTGCVSQLGDHLWEGKYSPRGPDGKKRSGNVYAHTREECEEKLKALIQKMKTELAAERERARQAS